MAVGVAPAARRVGGLPGAGTPWIQEQELLNRENAGYGMLFRTFDGKLLMALHYAPLPAEVVFLVEARLPTLKAGGKAIAAR